MKKYDAIIIGGGVIGSAVAYKLSELTSFSSIALLEKNHAACLETSLNNSGVIHSGIHLDPNSLKAKLAIHGRNELIEFCKKFDLPYKKRGMIVVSKLSPQLLTLKILEQRAKEQGIGARILDKKEILRHEPAIHAFRGILIEDVFVIDPKEFTLKLLAEAEKNNKTDIYFNTEVSFIEKEDRGYIVKTGNEIFEAPIIINAAGLYADRIARMAGYDYPVKFYSGEYYHVINKEKAGNIVGSLIYPASSPKGPGLGTHITKKPNDEVYLGPNAKLSDTFIFDPKKRTKPEEFIQEVKPYWPEIKPEDIEWAYVGMRPKIADGSKDFVIKKEAGTSSFVNLIGIESPGLTASLAIAERVKELITE